MKAQSAANLLEREAAEEKRKIETANSIAASLNATMQYRADTAAWHAKDAERTANWTLKISDEMETWAGDQMAKKAKRDKARLSAAEAAAAADEEAPAE